MRLNTIPDLKALSRSTLHTVPSNDASDLVARAPVVHLSMRDRLRNTVAPAALALLSPTYRQRAFRSTPDYPFDRIALDGRFALRATEQRFWRLARKIEVKRVLAVGTAGGDGDSAYFARHTSAEFHGIEYHNFRKHWDNLAKARKKTYQRDFFFHQMSVNQLTFPTAYFDLVNSSAVLEHLVDFDVAVDNIARVMRSGGLAMHTFGPLFFAYGGDHCASTLGPDHGYDHLLLDETAYQATVKQICELPGGDCAYWAKVGFFSYLKISEYFTSLARYFDFEFVVASVPSAAPRFRATHAREWLAMQLSGASETDLLVDGIFIILRRNDRAVSQQPT